MPPNYSQQQGKPLSRRERRAAAVLGAVVVLAGAGVGAWAAVGPAGGGGSQGKCVSLVVASSTGGGTIRYCGAAARQWCEREATGRDALAARARPACRSAGFASGH
jgi:hypothetical protein